MSLSNYQTKQGQYSNNTLKHTKFFFKNSYRNNHTV